MKRHIPGLHSRQQDRESLFEGLFLVRVDSASYRWHPQKPFLSLRFVILEPESFAEQISSPAGSIAPSEPCGSSIGSCVISAMTRSAPPGSSR